MNAAPLRPTIKLPFGAIRLVVLALVFGAASAACTPSIARTERSPAAETQAGPAAALPSPTQPPATPTETPPPTGTNTPAPTRTPRPTGTATRTPPPTPTFGPTETPLEALSPDYRTEAFDPPTLPLDALWTTTGRVVTAHAVEAESFGLAPDSWDLPQWRTESIQVFSSGTKIAYRVWNSNPSGDTPAGNSILVDDLATGTRHIYHYPHPVIPFYRLSDLHLSPDESGLLFWVQQGFNWAWMRIDLGDWSARPLPLDLDPLLDPSLMDISREPVGLQPVHATLGSALIPQSWAPAGILALKVKVGTDATPDGFYLVNPDTGAITLFGEVPVRDLQPAGDGIRYVFQLMDVAPADFDADEPYVTEVFLFDLSTGQTASLFAIANRLVSTHAWTPDRRALSYSLFDPKARKTATLGLYDPAAEVSQTLSLDRIPGLDPVRADIQNLDGGRFLVTAYAQGDNQTALYTLSIFDFSLETLRFIQQIPGEQIVLYYPPAWPD